MRDALSPTAAAAEAFRSGLVPAGKPALLAVSGGPDSLALLEAFADVAPEFGARLFAAHVDHGWRPAAAERERKFVERHCTRRGMRLFVGRAPARERGVSREDAARRARYAALSRIATEAGAGSILTAHTRDDAAETVLLALLRGRPLAGLSGIRVQRDDGVRRPFLGVSRDEIEAFLSRRGLKPLRDPSNRDLTLDRNRLRHRVLPLLRRNFGDAVTRNLAASAEALSRDREWIEEVFENSVATRLGGGRPEAFFESEFVRTLPSSALRRALLLLAEAARPGFAPTRIELLALEKLARKAEPFRFQAGRRVEYGLRRGKLFARAMEPKGVL